MHRVLWPRHLRRHAVLNLKEALAIALAVTEGLAELHALGRLFAFVLTGAPLPSRVPPEHSALRELVEQMTREDPEARPDIEEVRARLLGLETLA